MLTTSEKNFMREALSKGATEEQVVAFVQKKRQEIPNEVSSVEGMMAPPDERESLGGVSAPDAPGVYQGTTADLAGDFKKEVVDPTVGYLGSEEFVRPMLQGGFGAGGSLLGSGLGPAGTIAGGTSGFAIGDELADLIYKDRSGMSGGERVKDFANKYYKGLEGEALGLGLNATGQGLVNTGKGVYSVGSAIWDRLFGTSAASAARNEGKVGRILIDMLSKGDDDALTLLSRDVEMGDEVRDLIPAGEKQINPGMGQGSNDPKLLAMREKIRNLDPGKYDELLENQVLDSQDAVSEYLGKFFPEGGPGAEDTIGALKRVRENIARGETAAAEDLQVLADTASKMKGADEIVELIRDETKGAYDIAKDAMDARWKGLPNSGVEGMDTFNRLKNFQQDWAGKKERSLDKDFLKFLDDVMNDFYGRGGNGVLPPSKQVGFQDLRESISKAGQHAWDYGGSDPIKSRPYYALKDELESMLSGLQGKEYMALKKDYSEFKDLWDKGSVGDLLNFRKNLSNDKLARKFFSSGDVRNIEQLRRAIGDDKAKELLRAEALVNLRKSPAFKDATEEIDPSRYVGWYSKNKRVLEEAGLADEFKEFKGKAKDILDARVKSKEFQNASFSKALGNNPKEFFAGVYGSSKKSDQITKDILGALDKIRGDSAALEGMRNGFKEFVWDQVEEVSRGQKVLNADTFGDLMKKYEGTFKALYAGSPEKLGAMRNARRLMDTMYRKSARGTGDLLPKPKLTELMSDLLPFLIPKYSMVAGARGMRRLADTIGREELAKIFRKAAFNPNYAQAISEAATPADIEILLAPGQNYNMFPGQKTDALMSSSPLLSAGFINSEDK